MDAALEHGWTLLDAAETYGDAEIRIGRILRGLRDQVFLATKAFPIEPYSFGNVNSALDASLRRLKTDHIDLYQLHGPENWVYDFPETGAEELADSLNRLMASGKTLHVGLSNVPVERVRQLAAFVRLFSVQELLSLYDRESEHELLPFAASRGLEFIAYSPLSGGLLADHVDAARSFTEDDERFFLPRFRADIYPEFVRISRKLQAWANLRGRTLVELAVAWTLSRDGVTSTLVGAKTPEQVERVAAAEAWQLEEEELSEARKSQPVCRRKRGRRRTRPGITSISGSRR
ncbi:MAG: aldo/keto reductase [Gaiellaceae bacterium]